MQKESASQRSRPHKIRARDLNFFFWLIFWVLVLAAAWNLLSDDWLLTPLVAALSVLVVLLAPVLRIASRVRWNYVIVLMGALTATSVMLRRNLWEGEYPAVDGRVLFFIVLTLAGIAGRLRHEWHRRRGTF